MEYTPLPGLAPDGTLYENTAFGIREALLPPGPYATAHAPALLQLPNGDMLCAWFAGSFEGSADISVVYARLPQGAQHWQAPKRLSADPLRSEQNPSLFSPPGSGEVWAVYTAQLDRAEGKNNMQYTAFIRRQRSLDDGHTWQSPEALVAETGSFCRQPIQVLANGSWVFGNWKCFDDDTQNASDYAVVRISRDAGQSWQTAEIPNSRGLVHPNIVELAGGHLVAFMRSRAADWIWRAESFDYGLTWQAAAPTTLPNNNSSISAIRLQSGRVAIAYNPTSAPVPTPGRACWPGLRCPVAVALSEDGGISWPMVRVMEPGEGFAGPENTLNNSQYEYPYLMQSPDGMLHLAYAYKNRATIKYMQFTEAAVAGEKRGRGAVYNPTAAQK